MHIRMGNVYGSIDTMLPYILRHTHMLTIPVPWQINTMLIFLTAVNALVSDFKQRKENNETNS